MASIGKIHNGKMVGKGDFAVWDDKIHLIKEKTLAKFHTIWKSLLHFLPEIEQNEIMT